MLVDLIIVYSYAVSSVPLQKLILRSVECAITKTYPTQCRVCHYKNLSYAVSSVPLQKLILRSVECAITKTYPTQCRVCHYKNLSYAVSSVPLQKLIKLTHFTNKICSFLDKSYPDEKLFSASGQIVS